LVTDRGKILALFGLILLGASTALMLFGRTHLRLGRLPGDIVYRGKSTTFYFPLATSILLSVALSVVLYLIGRFRR
jgi:Protein of unknown function (DUF2905)